MNDILFNESGLDSLITRLENTKNSMQESLNDCKEKLKQIEEEFTSLLNKLKEE